MKLFVYGFGILFLISCGEKPISIEHSTYDNFSNLSHIEHPTIELFDNYLSFPISITNGDFVDHNSILYLTESTNLVPIQKENLKKLLPKSEFDDLIRNQCEDINSMVCSKEYFAYGRIVKPNYILLEYGIREYGDWGRHYVFEFRTYESNGKLISKLDFAKWSNKDNEFFEGKLTPEMNIEITSNGKIIQKYQINEFGEIEKR
ncbi:MAG: hypothetical protein ACI97N_001363 [Cognaticolwellia sp.]|jgi:hypothetical protein